MHPFAKYIQVLGKGRNGMRPLSLDESYDAMKMITTYDLEPEQLGAFLMLMRVKEESAEEVAGFTRALKESLPLQASSHDVAIDWAAYAGKKRHLPWFVLAALILSEQGYPVFMHGLSRDDDRIYVPQVLQALGIKVADSLTMAQTQLAESGFSYLSIENLSPLSAQLISTRELFGLRSPLHTVARMLNPFSAPLSLIGVFHPNFAPIHQHAARLLEQPRSLVCKGEGGELERIPDRVVELYGVTDGLAWQETWQHNIKPGSEIKPGALDVDHFLNVWNGLAVDRYAEAAVIGTLALVIRAQGIEQDRAHAHGLAAQWWESRQLQTQVKPRKAVS